MFWGQAEGLGVGTNSSCWALIPCDFVLYRIVYSGQDASRECRWGGKALDASICASDPHCRLPFTQLLSPERLGDSVR